MFGMSRDKYGSAVVAGFFKAVEALRPKGIKVHYISISNQQSSLKLLRLFLGIDKFMRFGDLRYSKCTVFNS